MSTTPDDVLAMSVRDFAAATAARKPTPGGGSVAGAVGALAVALGEMSLAFTRGKKKFAEHEQDYAVLARRLARARGMFEDLVADDIAAYTLYQQATAREEGLQRDEAVALATAAAINVPREAAKLSLALLADLESLSGRCSKWLVSDLVASAALAVAVARLCDYNVRVNAAQLADADEAAAVRAGSREDLHRAEALRERIEATVVEQLP